MSSTVIDAEKSTSDTKLRCLELKWRNKITNVLSVGDKWQQVAGNVRHPDDETKFLYSTSNIDQLERGTVKGERTVPAERFLQDWSITGRRQPTIQDLLDVLIDVKLFQAANYLSEELLGVAIPPNLYCNSRTEEEQLASLLKKNKDQENNDTCHDIPENKLSIQCKDVDPSCETSDIETEKNTLQSDTCTERQIFRLCGMQNYGYSLLAEKTGNFCDISVQNNGFKLGEGGFGIVYRAYIRDQWVAIKKLKDSIGTQFSNELELLCLYKHENLVPLLGYSNDGPYCCLIYTYMSNGSLMDRLACADSRLPVTWENRLHIALGTAKGIHHLHTFQSLPLIHRDIKSANILLGDNMIARIGDFGIARCVNSETMRTAFTSNICGTSVYMAPEAAHGEVSVKMDSFSFGVVLFELLTGLLPFDLKREDRDLVSHMDENCDKTEDIIQMLDVKAGTWDPELAISLYGIAKRCAELKKKDRPTVEQILPEISEIVNGLSC